MGVVKEESTTGIGYLRTFSGMLKIIEIILCIVPIIILSANFNEDVLRVDYDLAPPTLFVIQDFGCDTIEFKDSQKMLEATEGVNKTSCIRNG